MTTEPTNGHTPEQEREPGWQAFALLGQYLTDDGWHPQRVEDKLMYRMLFIGKNGEQRCVAQIRADLKQFLFYAIIPIRVPEELRLAMAEFITRANYGLRVGNLEMDFSDGEVRYKSSLDFEGEMLTTNWIKNAIYPAVQTLDRYLPGIMKVLYAGKTPLESIKEIEG